MAKTHSVTWKGFAGVAFVGSVMLGAVPVVAEKAQAFAQGTREVACAVETALSGVVQSGLLDCENTAGAGGGTTGTGSIDGD